MRLLRQSTATNVMVFMTAASDHVTGLAGLTLTITMSKNGAAFAGIAPVVTDRGDGWYNVALSATDTDTLGDLAFHVTGAAADPTDFLCRVVAGSLDADVSSRLATGSYTAPDNASIASIVGKTNQLVFTVAGQVDSNVQYVNDIEVQGDGQPGTEWGPV